MLWHVLAANIRSASFRWEKNGGLLSQQAKDNGTTANLLWFEHAQIQSIRQQFQSPCSWAKSVGFFCSCCWGLKVNVALLLGFEWSVSIKQNSNSFRISQFLFKSLMTLNRIVTCSHIEIYSRLEVNIPYTWAIRTILQTPGESTWQKTTRRAGWCDIIWVLRKIGRSIGQDGKYATEFWIIINHVR